MSNKYIPMDNIDQINITLSNIQTSYQQIKSFNDNIKLGLDELLKEMQDDELSLGYYFKPFSEEIENPKENYIWFKVKS